MTESSVCRGAKKAIDAFFAKGRKAKGTKAAYDQALYGHVLTTHFVPAGELNKLYVKCPSCYDHYNKKRAS